MFLKLDKIFKNPSIANKFTLMYTSASILILIIIALALSWTLSDLMLTAEKQYLNDEAYVIKGLLDEHGQQLSAIKQEVDGVPKALRSNASYYYFINIKDENGKILMRTPGAEEKINNAPFPTISNTNWKNYLVNWQPKDDDSYVLMSAPLTYDQSGKVKLSMEMALNVNYPKSLIVKYNFYILIFLILLFALLIVLGKFIAKSSLRSLYEMAKMTQKITATKLSNRIDHKEWPKELISLGKSFNEMIIGIEQAFNNLSRCSNELAHELRMPINNLIGSTEIILSKPRDLMEYKILLESNLEEFRRLSKLTDNILFLARSEFPNAAITITTIQLEQEVSKICEFYKVLAAEKKITIHQKGQATLQGDQLLIQRAITNLLSNAIKYCPDNSNILFDITQHNGITELTIEDDGIGISEENLRNIFDRFYKVDSASSQMNSWGLGLSIVKTIMDLHKGSIQAKSELGKGSWFCLIFPGPTNFH